MPARVKKAAVVLMALRIVPELSVPLGPEPTDGLVRSRAVCMS
jgi:hypothetical protein